MTYSDLRQRADDLIATIDINQRYHQRMASRWSMGDKFVRILVGVLATWSVFQAGLGTVGLQTTIAASTSLVIAIALNVIPFRDQEQFYKDLFHRWGQLRRVAESYRFSLLRNVGSQADVPAEMLDEFSRIVDQRYELEVDEPAPWRGLLACCQEDHNESLWGRGVRTESQVQKKRHELALAQVKWYPADDQDQSSGEDCGGDGSGIAGG